MAVFDVSIATANAAAGHEVSPKSTQRASLEKLPYVTANMGIRYPRI